MSIVGGTCAHAVGPAEIEAEQAQAYTSLCHIGVAAFSLKIAPQASPGYDPAVNRQIVFALLVAFQATAATNQWETEIQRFEASDHTNAPPKSPILFVGSSSIRLWRSVANDIAPHPVLNRGFGGSEVSDSVHFAERIVIPYKPRLIVMYAGGNDIHRGKSPETVFSDFKAFVQKVTSVLPETRIAYISIAPNPARWGEVERVKGANALIARFAEEHPRVEFIDVFTHMLGADGMPRPEIFVSDRLHMNEQGYALWTKIIKPKIDEWLKEHTRRATAPGPGSAPYARAGRQRPSR